MPPDALRDLWLMFQRDRRCSIDRMLCSPDLRDDFVTAARQIAPLAEEEELLTALLRLRKNKTLPRAGR
jgi:hypothetical protein